MLRYRRKERADGTFMEFCLLSLLDSEIDVSQCFHRSKPLLLLHMIQSLCENGCHMRISQ